VNLRDPSSVVGLSSPNGEFIHPPFHARAPAPSALPRYFQTWLATRRKFSPRIPRTAGSP